MKTILLTGLMVMVVACSGAKTSGGEGQGEKQTELKRQAANAQGKASGDVCADNDWYGDGVCDTFCRDLDVDCTVSDDDVVCLTYIEEPNGSCDREPGEPCIGQDPDCEASVDPTPPEPTICTAIARQPDGVCEPDPNDPCVAYQDPDCSQGSGGGSTPADPGPGDGDDSTPGNPGPSCKIAPEPANGVCEREPSDPCLAADPDCIVVCTAISEASDGICSRDPKDPCIFQDPDCGLK